LVLCFFIATPASAAPLTAGTYSFGGVVTVGPGLSARLPDLTTGDLFTGLLTIPEPEAEGFRVAMLLALSMGDYALTSQSHVTGPFPTIFYSSIASMPALGPTGYITDLTMWFPNDTTVARWSAVVLLGGSDQTYLQTYLSGTLNTPLTRVPEPATWLLMALGLCGTLTLRGRHNVPP
jgi:hypothetical protein